MTNKNNTNSDDEKIKRICELEGYNYDSPERINAMTLLDNGYEFEKPNSDEPSKPMLTTKKTIGVLESFIEDPEFPMAMKYWIPFAVNKIEALNEENKRLEALPKVGDDIYKAFDKGVNWSKYLKGQYPLDDEDLEDEITRLKENGAVTLRERNHFEDCLNEVGDKAKDLYAENQQLTAKIEKAKKSFEYILGDVGREGQTDRKEAKEAITELEK